MFRRHIAAAAPPRAGIGVVHVALAAELAALTVARARGVDAAIVLGAQLGVGRLGPRTEPAARHLVERVFTIERRADVAASPAAAERTAGYRSVAAANLNGNKGEGLAGTPRYVLNPVTNTLLDTGVEGYPNGSRARGAPGNAGGGGTDGNPASNDQNSGGGGGGNGGSGGQGGNSWSSNLAVGGFGGKAAPASLSALFMGGGGGSGSRNNGSGVQGSGGAGGGIVIIRAGQSAGTGTVTANGRAGTASDNDGAGGGGAGGTVIVMTASGTLSGVSVSASGGNGGNAWPAQAPGTNNSAAHGPGGGGGGGIVYTNVAGASVTAANGTNGTSTTNVVAFGAQPGVTGTVPGGVLTRARVRAPPARCWGSASPRVHPPCGAGRRPRTASP